MKNNWLKISILSMFLLLLTVILVLCYPKNVNNAGNKNIEVKSISDKSIANKNIDTNQIFNIKIDTAQIHGIPVYLNNKYIGKSPISKELPPGIYSISARSAGHVGSVRHLTLKPTDLKEQDIILPVDQHYYQQFLDEIIKMGYQPIRVIDFYNNVRITNKTIVLRHDVDVSATYALEMAKMEQAKGIKSTYYFRWSTADPNVIKTIRSMGHEVGLHYETLATYVKEKNIKSSQEITPAVKEKLRDRLKLEIAEFKQKFGDIYTIASHGADENIKISLSNYQAIVQGQNPADFGIVEEAYGEILKHFTYISDSGGFWEPFPYPKIANDNGPFYFLIHPIHWTSSYGLIQQAQPPSSFTNKTSFTNKN